MKLKELLTKEFFHLDNKLDDIIMQLNVIQEAMKEQRNGNNNGVFTSLIGHVISGDKDTQTEILQVYKSLFGSSASCLPGVDFQTSRRGPILSSIASYMLIQSITHEEIDKDLKGIDDKKALRPDDFRPIACCTHLQDHRQSTNTIHSVIGEVVNVAQSGFIPQRHISDNILMATEFVKGYNRKHISPRCMIKVDLKKSYDSIVWSFLFTVLMELGFQEISVN
ncbi:uncharacterized protein [Spinacia oleracea]|uniref:Reverse transcriptase domain-containing protein n=1 Tax=Spinacia oleracea TaxID=3562 RepID=A0ABM3R1C0_SPIOL|nr:uncharacterized protein LOC110780715 [Spinacia oleracea]